MSHTRSMRRPTHHALAGFVLTGMLALAACGGTASTNAGTTKSSTPHASGTTTAPTATAKPKPTGAPAITMAFCQSVMTVDEANSIMTPATPATTIDAASDSSGNAGGSCLYYSTGPNIVLSLLFADWSGPVPIPQQDIANLLTQYAGIPGMTVNSANAISGLGDQAEYIAATSTTSDGTVTFHILYVLDGKVLTGCSAAGLNSAAPAGTQNQLQQCAAQVVGRL